jgi:hypothetical protein
MTITNTQQYTVEYKHTSAVEAPKSMHIARKNIHYAFKYRSAGQITRALKQVPAGSRSVGTDGLQIERLKLSHTPSITLQRRSKAK